MTICHTHNFTRNPATPKTFGVRITMRKGDTLASILGTDWERVYWFATPEQRDRALKDMAAEHLYSRRGDHPTLNYEPIERTEDTGGGRPHSVYAH